MIVIVGEKQSKHLFHPEFFLWLLWSYSTWLYTFLTKKYLLHNDNQFEQDQIVKLPLFTSLIHCCSTWNQVFIKSLEILKELCIWNVYPEKFISGTTKKSTQLLTWDVSVINNCHILTINTLLIDFSTTKVYASIRWYVIFFILNYFWRCGI